MEILKKLNQNDVYTILKTAGKDFAWADETEVNKWLINGFAAGNSKVACVALPMETECLLTKNFRKNLPFVWQKNPEKTENINLPQKTFLVLPLGDFQEYLKYADRIIKNFTETAFLVLVAVKPNYELQNFFRLGFALYDVVLLNDLRPFYVFALLQKCENGYNIEKGATNATQPENFDIACIATKTDTYTVLKYIKDGNIGVCEKDGNILFVKCPPF
ncbi:MAG: hypothetical protein RR902_00495 [Oscillospiraceae bacterium]